jgi:hypothetical protein
MQALWMARLENSTTIMLALQKLNEKTGAIKEKDKIRWRQRFIQSAVTLGGLGTSAVTGSSAPLIGGNMFSQLAGPNSVKDHLESVSNADMVLLARAVEDEQFNLMKQYIELRQAIEEHHQIEEQMTAVNALGETLPQEQPLKVAQYFSLNQLMAQKLSAAKARVEVAKSVLEQSTNPRVVADIEQAILLPASPELEEGNSSSSSSSGAEEIMLQ